MIKNEKRTVKDEEVFIDDRSLIFGNGMKLRVLGFFLIFFLAKLKEKLSNRKVTRKL